MESAHHRNDHQRATIYLFPVPDGIEGPFPSHVAHHQHALGCGSKKGTFSTLVIGGMAHDGRLD
jgi:hypothetical protein